MYRCHNWPFWVHLVYDVPEIVYVVSGVSLSYHYNLLIIFIDVPSSPVTGIDEASPSNAANFLPHLDDETEMSADTLLPLEEAMARCNA